MHITEDLYSQYTLPTVATANQTQGLYLYLSVHLSSSGDILTHTLRFPWIIQFKWEACIYSMRLFMIILSLKLHGSKIVRENIAHYKYHKPWLSLTYHRLASPMNNTVNCLVHMNISQWLSKESRRNRNANIHSLALRKKCKLVIVALIALIESLIVLVFSVVCFYRGE